MKGNRRLRYLAALLFGACAGFAAADAAAPPPIRHIVVVIEENRSFEQIEAAPEAAYFKSLAAGGAYFTNAYAVEHPSQPNYLDLFSGGNQGVTNDSCPHSFSSPNLARSLLDGGSTFGGFSEGLPAVGFAGCSAGPYRRKHNPWINFSNVPRSLNLPLTSFPADFSTLPAVSFVVPSQANDMHDGTILQADRWLRAKVGPYAEWAGTHDSLLIVIWDEDDSHAGNHIPLIIAGGPVQPGRYSMRVDHFSVLRLIEEAFGLPLIGASATAAPITGIWKQTP